MPETKQTRDSLHGLLCTQSGRQCYLFGRDVTEQRAQCIGRVLGLIQDDALTMHLMCFFVQVTALFCLIGLMCHQRAILTCGCSTNCWQRTHHQAIPAAATAAPIDAEIEMKMSFSAAAAAATTTTAAPIMDAKKT